MQDLLVRGGDSTADDLGRGMEDIVAEERVRGRTLRNYVVIREIWRVSHASLSERVAENPEDLHLAIPSLPGFPWMDVEIAQLSVHPLSEARRALLRPDLAANRRPDRLVIRGKMLKPLRRGEHPTRS